VEQRSAARNVPYRDAMIQPPGIACNILMILDDANFCAARADIRLGIEFQREHSLLRPILGQNPGTRSATSSEPVHALLAG